MVKFDVAEFLEANRIVAAEGGGSKAVADLLGLTLSQVHSRRFLLKKKGIRLPSIRSRAYKKSRQVTCHNIGNVEPSKSDITFTITVGG